MAPCPREDRRTVVTALSGRDWKMEDDLRQMIGRVQRGTLSRRGFVKRMAALGMAVNLFANHIYYWGDQHWETTVGPERASRMNACAAGRRSSTFRRSCVKVTGGWASLP